MNFRDIIEMGLTEYMNELRKALDGLVLEERRFQPTSDSHHIDFTVWHMARVEDHWIHRFAKGERQIWQTHDWYKKFGISEKDTGFGYTSQQVMGLPQFDIGEMLSYYSEVRDETLYYLHKVTPEELSRCPDPEHRPRYTIASMFSHIMIEESQHVGQIAYIRGMQRGLDK